MTILLGKGVLFCLTENIVCYFLVEIKFPEIVVRECLNKRLVRVYVCSSECTD